LFRRHGKYLVAARALDLGSVWLGVHILPCGTGASVILVFPSGSVLGVAVIGIPDEVKEPTRNRARAVVHRNGW
jgi:hypothetical protein